MLKRQESSLSASRRQTTAGTTTPPPESHHAKAIGCMSGIIKLFSKYQNSNRRLTFGKKQEKQKKPPPPPTTPPTMIINSDTKPLTCAVKVLRSPTLPPELRRSNAASSPENSRTPPSSLVARLMGLEDLGAKRPENTVTEKRQQLLRALEKCNEDLEALKKIIKAVQAADVRLQPPHSPPAEKSISGDGNGGSLAVPPCIKMGTELSAEKDESTRSPLSSHSVVVQNSVPDDASNKKGKAITEQLDLCEFRLTRTKFSVGRVPQHRKPTAAKKPGEDEEDITRILTKSTIMESSLEMRRRAAAAAASPPWSSRAMVESVEEVCSDVEWNEKREIGRIGVVVQDHVCRELIEELVKDLKSCTTLQPLPLEACKRRLRF